jgi:KaiC/GvpD/RAD55 family RecA-like ATPase
MPNGENNGNGESMGDVDVKLKEIEELMGMLEVIKADLERKEELLEKAERALEETENVLEGKISKITEKDEKLGNIERILRSKEEEMQIQEIELQTNAALEYLSFKEREEDLGERRALVEDEEAQNELVSKVKDLTGLLEKSQHEIDELRASGGGVGGGGGGGEGGGEVVLADAESAAYIRQRERELNQQEQETMDMRENLRRIAEQLKEKEMDLRHEKERREKSDDLPEDFQAKLEEIQRREKETKGMEKEIENYKEMLEQVELQLKSKGEEMEYRESELKKKEEEILSKAGMSADQLQSMANTEQDIEFRLKKEISKREKIVEAKAEQRIAPLMNKISNLQEQILDQDGLAEELESQKAKLAMAERQSQERFEEIQFMEQKIQKRQEALIHDRRSLDVEKDKMKEELAKARSGDGAVEVEEAQQQLKELQLKLREREEFLRKKEMEMRRMQDKIIDEEISMESAVEMEGEVSKIRTGVARMDDMLYGGLPPNSNTFIYGPPFLGKQTLLNLFIADGLKRGIPAIYVLTDKTPQEVKDNIKAIIPKIDQFEKKKMIHWVDAYSRSMELPEDNPNTQYVDKVTALDAITMAVVNIQKGFKTKYHKLCFHSLSTLLAYTDAMATFRFLQTLTARSKRAHCVAMYCMDAGMQSDSDVATLKHLMNGMVEFKEEDLKTFLRVEGIGDVRTKAYVQYSHTTKSINIMGSFAVDHIR